MDTWIFVELDVLDVQPMRIVNFGWLTNSETLRSHELYLSGWVGFEKIHSGVIKRPGGNHGWVAGCIVVLVGRADAGAEHGGWVLCAEFFPFVRDVDGDESWDWGRGEGDNYEVAAVGVCMYTSITRIATSLLTYT